MKLSVILDVSPKDSINKYEQLLQSVEEMQQQKKRE